MNTKSLILKGIISLAILIGVVYAGLYFFRSLNHESTDNAYVTGSIVPISAEVKGQIVSVSVRDNQLVTKGATLLEIFPNDYTNKLSEQKQSISRLEAEKLELRATVEEKNKALLQAQANLKAAVSEEALASKELNRYATLLKEETVSQSQYDNKESIWKVAHAKEESARASAEQATAAIKTLKAKEQTQDFKIEEATVLRSQAQLDLARTIIKAPVSGRIAMKNADPGKYVQPGQALLSIVQEDTWVVANFKETQIKKMTVGQPVEITLDAYSGKTFQGHIDSLQPGTGAVFSLLPPENATGNFVKVVQRIPVKIVLDSKPDPAHPLWPGLSVIASVDVSRQTGPNLK